jgi:hypothetical protein
MKRGIITNPGIIVKHNNGVSISKLLSKTDLNYYVLYWDKIIMPTNNMIHIAIPNESELISSKIIERPRVAFGQWSASGPAYYNPLIVAQSIITNELIEKEKEIDWTIHQIGDGIIVGKDQQKEYESIKVEILNCLPVPSDEVDVQKILNFKEKRKDELLALHSAIDDIYFEILKSPDKNLSTKKEISTFKKNLDDLKKASKESFKKSTKYNFTTELNINGKDLGLALGGGATFDFFTSGMTIPIGTVVSGIASLIKIKASRTYSVEKAKEKTKLNYLASASKKNII